MTSRTGRSRALVYVLLALGAVLAPGAAYAQVPGLPPVVPQPPDDDEPGGGGPGSSPKRPAPLPAPEPSSQATAYRINAGRTGHSVDGTILPPLALRWTRDLGATVSYPLIAEGRVFVIVSTGNNGAGVAALDRRTGRTLWTARVGHSYNTAYHAFDRGRLYVVDADGALHAFDARSGRRLWAAPQSYGSGGPPLATGGVVYLSTNNKMVALNGTTGARLWEAQVNGSEAAPAADGRLVYGSYACAQSYAFNRNDGARVWHASSRCSGGGTGYPILNGGRLYVEDGLILDAATGRRLGQLKTNGLPAFAGNTAIVTGDRVTRALDTASQRVLWSRRGGSECSVRCPFPIIVGHIVWAHRNGKLVGRDLATGRTRFISSTVPSEQADQIYGQMIPDLGAGEGIIAVPAGHRLSAYSSVLNPPADGSHESTADDSIQYGGATTILGAVGTRLRAGRVRVGLIASPFPYRRSRGAGAASTRADGTYSFRVRPRRNTFYRTRVNGKRSRGGTIFVYPRLRDRFSRGRGRQINRLRASVRLVAPRRARLRGRRLSLYLVQPRRRRVVRIGSARLRGGSGRARGTIHFNAIRSIGRRDYFFYCLKGLSRVGLGARDLIDRRCGARRLPY